MAEKRSHPPSLRLTREAPATRGCARALAASGRRLRRTEVGIATNPTAKAVHDYRVALRTLRAVFSAAGKLVDSALRAQITADFRWLGQRSSPVRDLDVLIDALPRYCAWLPAPDAALLARALEPALSARRAHYVAVLVAAAKSRRYTELWRNWARLINQLQIDSGEALGTRIDRILKRHVTKLSKFKRKDFKRAEPLHQLRKRCKRLRYVVETFRHWFEPETIDATLNLLKAAQTALGEYWDVVVHQRVLHELAAGADDVPENALATLLERMIDEQQQRSTQVKAVFDLLRTLRVTLDHRVEPHPAPA
ncbi:MAG: CHAD domain-containing protein [Gammaproteobacteria bacterium]|nr:CHAD domain-containing protein [Gammaproteobacteria bacterium]